MKHHLCSSKANGLMWETDMLTENDRNKRQKLPNPVLGMGEGIEEGFPEEVVCERNLQAHLSQACQTQR